MKQKCKCCDQEFEVIGGPKRYCHNCIKVNLICSECGNEFQISRALYQHKLNKQQNWFCSRECVQKNQKVSFLGEKNHFFKGKHSDITKSKLKEVRERNKDIYKSKTFRKTISDVTVGEKNPFYGKHHTQETKEKLRKANLGKHEGINNHMYGKPSPTGSGNGWSGWYKNWFFRSIKELSFMITVIERFKFNWISGESKTYKIEYKDCNGNKRNYFPDFILNNKYMIEIKPKKLWNTNNVLYKRLSAEDFCKDRELKYKLFDPITLKTEDIKKYYNNGIIKFLPRYEEKFLNLIKEKL
jgi:hypothetical protein